MVARAAVLCLGVLLACPSARARAEGFPLLPDYRIPDAEGKYYVVCERLGGPEHFGEWGPTAFAVAERAPGTPPVTAAKADFENLAGQGGRYYRMHEDPDVTVRPGDVVHGRGRFETPPRVVLVSSTGLGFVALDVYGPNIPIVSEGRGGHAVLVFSLRGTLCHAKKLSDLFTSDEIGRFRSNGSTLSWLRGGWINEDRQDLVIVGGNDELRVLNLASGEVRNGGEEDVVRGLSSADPAAAKQALIISADRKLQAAAEPARGILADSHAPADVRLRAAVALAVMGDRSGAGLIHKTALAGQPANSATEAWDRQYQRAVAIEYLPEAIGERALPLLDAALCGGKAEGSAAFKALVKLGAKAVPMLGPTVVDEPDRRLRLAAIGILARLGPPARAAADQLAAALNDEDPLVRIKAAFALANVNPTDKGVLPVLREGLHFAWRQSWYFPVREVAAETLVRLGPDGVAVLGEVLEDEDVIARRAIVTALSQLGPQAAGAAGILVEALGDRDREVRDWSLRALARVGSEAIPALVGGLRHESASVRSGCAFVLGRLGPTARSSISALESTLADEDPLVRSTAAGALCQIKPRGSEGVATLIDLLQHPEEEIRAKAAFRLGQYGPRAKAATAPLIAALDDSDRAAAAAAAALGKIQPEASLAVGHLIRAAGEGGRLLRRDAVESLGRFGPKARIAVPALIERLEDDDWHDPHLDAASLGRIGSEAELAVPALASALQAGRGDSELRMATIEALSRFGPEAGAAVPLVIGALADSCPPVAQRAVQSVPAFGSAAVPGLIETLKHPSRQVRLNAAEALGLIGPDAQAAVPALIEALADVDTATGFYAEEPLERIGPAAVNHLIAALRDDRAVVRGAAARILGRLGGDAKPAVGALTAALKDPDEFVRSQAAYALANIGKAS